jgi:hypothetical protein
MKWRWGELRLQKDGTVGLCDAQSCLASSGTVAPGTDEKSWYWVAGAMQTTEIGGVGARKHLADEGRRRRRRRAGRRTSCRTRPTGGDERRRRRGAVRRPDRPRAHLHRMATENDLVDFRVGTVAFSTPAVLFQALCDEGRGDHVYAEWPFIAGPKHASVRYARSFVPLQWATLNTEIAPPLKVWDPARPAIRSYAVAFDGKRVTVGQAVVPRALADGRRPQAQHR